MSTLVAITGGRVLTMDPERRILEPGTVLIEDDQIMAVGPAAEVTVPAGAEVIDATGMAVLPGLVNVHTHVPQILLRGGASHDRDLYDWLVNVLYPGLNAYSGDDLRAAVTLYCVEAVRSGMTTIVANEDVGFHDYDAAAKPSIEAYEAAGVRVCYARMFSDRASPRMGELVESLMEKEPDVHHVGTMESTEYCLAELEGLFRRYHGRSNGRVQIWPAPANPTVLTPKAVHASRAMAEQWDVMWTVHINESPYENRSQMVPLFEWLNNIGALDARLLAAHCVDVSPRDIRLMRKYDVKVAHQAVSNGYLASGVAPIPAMIQAGITVGLGTDDANCNESVNLIADMKAMAIMHRAMSQDAGILTAEKIVEAATIDAARAIGMADRIGSLEVGKQADVITVDLRTPQTTPAHDLCSTLVYQAYGTEVDTVLVDGRVIMRGRELAFLPSTDMAAFCADASERSARILQASGLRGTRPWTTIGG